MDKLVIALVGGASIGTILALMALGMVLAFRATETFNFAHGQFMALPAFIIGYWLMRHPSMFWLAAAVSLVAIGAIGVLLYKLILVRTVGLPHFMPVVATLGLAAILDGAMAIVFGANQYVIHVPGLPTGIYTIFGARIATATLAVSGASLVLAIGLAALLRFTHIGMMLRAAGQDSTLASQGGINVHRMYAGSWMVASVLSGLAGIAYASTNVVNRSIVDLALIAFPALMLGGLDSVIGAVVGGILIGILQGFVATYYDGGAVNVITYFVLLMVLLWRPHGLFGTKQVTRL